MEDSNRVKPKEWLADSPKEKVIKQNDDSSAYLEVINVIFGKEYLEDMLCLSFSCQDQPSSFTMD